MKRKEGTQEKKINFLPLAWQVYVYFDDMLLQLFM